MSRNDEGGVRGANSAAAAWTDFARADRRCRHPGAVALDFLARAAAFAARGERDLAAADIAAAGGLDPDDITVNRAALAWGNAEERERAAKRLVESDRAGPGALADAVAALLSAGAPAVWRVRFANGEARGWAAWAAGRDVALRFVSESRGPGQFRLSPAPGHELRGAGRDAADFRLDRAEAASLFVDGREALVARRPPRLSFEGDRRAPSVRGESPLTAIVPIYNGFEETRECLASLFAQQGPPFPIILVDDASPDPRVGALLDEAALRPGVTRLTNAANLGFARSVNRALALCKTGDVLLLNSDTVLPPLAVARLFALARSEPGIGTVTPFSNNSQLTTYPKPNAIHPLPAAETLAALAEAAWRANGDRLVDLPTGIGFCLLIARGCLDALPKLPESYGRGYYEDIEYCLAARERGFRNVCATGVYIGHSGSASFKEAKLSLTLRNLATLEDRIPYRLRESVGFARADPLGAARAAFDEFAPAPAGAVLLVAGAGASTWRAQQRAAAILEEPGAKASAIVASVSADGRRVELRSAGEEPPASLSFRLDPGGLKRAGDYFRRLEPQRVDVFEAATAPDAFLDLVLGLGAPVDLRGPELWGRAAPPRAPRGGCPSPQGPAPCRACAGERAESGPSWDLWLRGNRRSRLFSAGRALYALDRMGNAYVERRFGAQRAIVAPAPVRSPDRRLVGPKLGVLVPWPSVATDRLLTALARRLASAQQPEPAVVVLGACVNEPEVTAASAVFVVGAASPREYEGLIERYRIGRLAVLDRYGFFGVLDACAAAVGQRKAYFDASEGAEPVAPGDLALDPRICDAKAVGAIAAWLREGEADTAG